MLSFFGGEGARGCQRLKQLMFVCSQIDVSYNKFSPTSAPDTCPDTL